MITELVQQYGGVALQAVTLAYLGVIKLNSISGLEKNLEKVLASVEKAEDRLLKHESRISRIEGKLNGQSESNTE